MSVAGRSKVDFYERPILAQSGPTPKHRGLLSADLGQRVARQFVECPETLKVLIGCKPRRDVAEDFGNDCVPCRGSELPKPNTSGPVRAKFSSAATLPPITSK